MYVRLDGLGATAAPVTITQPDTVGSIVGSITSVFGAIGSGFLTADAAKYAAKQQSKSDQFAAMAQQNVGIEQAQASERIAAASERASTERTAILSQVLTTGIVAASVVAGLYFVAKAFSGK